MNMETEGLTFTHENAAAYAQVELTGLYLYAARLIRTKLGPLNGKLNTVVDFGCGAGKSTRAIAKWLNPDGTLIGVDISASMLEHAQRLNHEARPQLPEVNFNYKQIENGIIPLATASVDAVTSSLVLQEVQSERELEEILLEIGRVTKPGGEFIAVVPNDHLRSEDFVTITYTPFPENLTRTDNIRKCKLKDSPIIWEKDRHWSKEIYSRLAEKAGFQILAFEYPLADPTHPPFPSTPEIPWKDELKTSPAMLMHAIKIP